MTIYCFSLDKMFRCLLKDLSKAIQCLSNKDFEYFWKRGQYQLKPLTKGGFGAIYELYINNEKVVDQYQSDVIVKSNNNSFRTLPVKFQGVWLLDFDVAEVYFCPFVSYLTKMNVCPFLCNYISANIVDNDYVLFIERYAFEIMTFLPQLTPDYVVQFLFQLTYAFYIMKQYLGMVHFDVHLRNVMTAKSSTSFLLFDQFRKRGIYLPFMEYEARLIDFGFCTIDLRYSIDPYLKSDIQCAPHNFRRSLEISDLFKTTRETRSKLLTVELQYFCLHLYQIIQRQAPTHPILTTIQQFCDCMYQQPTNLMAPALEPNKFILHEHDVGVVCSVKKPGDLMAGLERYCQLYGSVVNENGNQLYTPFRNVPFDKSRMRVVTPINKAKIYEKYQNFLKSDIPDLRWYEPSFTVFENAYGHVYKFPINCWVELTKNRPYNGIGIYRKNVPYNSNNAYVTHNGSRVLFHVNRRAEDFVNSFYAGKFMIIDGKVSSCEFLPQLMFGLTDKYFYVFYLKMKCKNTEKFMRRYRFNYLIDASFACGFYYQGDTIYEPSDRAARDIQRANATLLTPLIYISINE